MAIRANHISSTIVYTTMDHDDGDEQAAGSDEDERSDTSSDITELDPAEFPQYFQERNGRLFHSHGELPYPLPVDAAEQNVSNVISLESRYAHSLDLRCHFCRGFLCCRGLGGLWTTRTLTSVMLTEGKNAKCLVESAHWLQLRWTR